MQNINEITITDIKTGEGWGALLSEHDHLLRRFGFVELQELKIDQPSYTFREQADEILVLLEGRADLTIIDRRKQSPSFNQIDRLPLSGSRLQRILIPFGIAYRLEISAPAKLLRVSTHARGTHPGDRSISPGELEAVLNPKS